MGRTGICRLCGETRKLTLEHVPPEAAYNDKKVFYEMLSDAVNGRNLRNVPRKLGVTHLCEPCNSTTGGKYGNAFVNWARQGMEYLDKIVDKKPINLKFNIEPLKVIKQAYVMCMALGSSETVNTDAELKKVLLNFEERLLNPKYRVYVYLNSAGGSPRLASEAAVGRTDLGATVFVLAEVALPPFGYVILKAEYDGDLIAKHQQLCDISHFSNFQYGEKAEIFLTLPILETHEPFPLDYRSKEEIYNRVPENQFTMGSTL
jgi:hypothetical protein